MNLIKKLPAAAGAFAVIGAMILFLAFPARYTECVLKGVSLWAVSVLPATFPFLFLTALFRRGKLFPRLTKIVSPLSSLFRVSGAGGCAALISVLSGYPVGAKTVLDLYENGAIGKEEVFRVACLSSTTGPMFLVGAVGVRMFQSAAVGWIMFCSHLLAVWSVGFLFRFTGKKSSLPVRLPKPQGDLYDVLSSSVLSILCVGGSIALFFAFGQMIADLGALAGIENPVLTAVIRGMLEMTSGCALLSEHGTPVNAALAAFLVTFGGFCVLMQQIVYLSKANIKALPFLLVKLLQGALAFGICLGLYLLVFSL